ncbi:MAG: imidazole glycerol phosphate synthase subunit HisH [Spongiibacteraceae bacterium]|nr:imidazole glycerol phosphate synthase subunit HisH [Spongiibacteraceae bacterium]
MAKTTVAVIDYGMGNLHSVASALENVNQQVDVIVTADAQKIRNADRVIFPGVGAIGECLTEIRRLGIDEIVSEAARNKPLLAICVGMQALMDFSEESGGVECLGMFPGKVLRFAHSLADEHGSKLKVPHMGWNQVKQHIAHPLWQGIKQNSRFYFVHSYYVQTQNSSLIAASTDYGLPIHAALHHDNVFAVQFHPEKSSVDGLTLLSNFLKWNGQS